MNLGTSIFISSLMLAITAIFIATKDVWNWKRIILGPIIVVSLIAIAAYNYDTIQHIIQQRAKNEISFGDISMGATKGDVKFLKGEPTRESQSEDREVAWYYTGHSGSGPWEYYVKFDMGKVYLVVFTGPDALSGTGIQGINIGDSSEMIFEKFGRPSNISKSKDELKRIYSFKRYGIVFEMKADRVFRYGVFDPRAAPNGLSYPAVQDASQNPMRNSSKASDSD